ncbi:MAG: D-galactonate transporter [Armatimonadota bacterium]
MSTSTSTISDPGTAQWHRTAWLIVALLAPVALLNYFDRQMLAAMKSSVMQDIPSVGSDANWGLMLGQFKWVYAAMSPIGGYLADRFSRRWTICASLLAWSVITWLTGHATTYEQLMWSRSAMGISEAFYIPAGLALIADYHFGSTRAKAVGWHQAAIYCGVILGGFTGYIADSPTLGWRFAFDAAGIVGILYGIVLFFFLKDAPRPAGTAGLAIERPSVAVSAKALFTNPSFILMVLYFTLPALSGWVVRDWMPAILKDKFHIGQGLAGVSATLYTNLAALGAVFLGGYLSDKAIRKNIRGRIFVSATGMALIVPAIFGVGNASSLGMAIGFLMLFGAGWGLFDGNNMPILSQVVRPEQRATAYGLMNLVSISCGGLADFWFGKMRDAKIPLNVIFGMFSLTVLVSVGLILLVRPKPELSADTQPAGH